MGSRFRKSVLNNWAINLRPNLPSYQKKRRAFPYEEKTCDDQNLSDKIMNSTCYSSVLTKYDLSIEQ